VGCTYSIFLQIERIWYAAEFVHPTGEHLECDFLTVDTVFFRRFYVLFVLELQSRGVHLAGISANPGRAWVSQ